MLFSNYTSFSKVGLYFTYVIVIEVDKSKCIINDSSLYRYKNPGNEGKFIYHEVLGKEHTLYEILKKASFVFYYRRKNQLVQMKRGRDFYNHYLPNGYVVNEDADELLEEECCLVCERDV